MRADWKLNHRDTEDTEFPEALRLCASVPSVVQLFLLLSASTTSPTTTAPPGASPPASQQPVFFFGGGVASTGFTPNTLPVSVPQVGPVGANCWSMPDHCCSLHTSCPAVPAGQFT